MDKPNFQKLDECPGEYQDLKLLDESESIFFARELEHIKSKTYDIKYPELKARSLFMPDFSSNAGAETITYEQFSNVGMAKIISNYADDLPRADVKGKEFTSRVRTIASSYGYNFDEIQAAKMAGRPLKERKASSARRADMVLENSIAFFGDTEHDLQGFLSNANVNTVVLLADGAGSSKTFASKTPVQIVRDLAALPTAVHSNTNGVEDADTLMMPLEQYNLIFSTHFSAASDKTIGEWFLGSNPHIKEIVWVNEMKNAAGGGSLDLMVAYKRSSEKLSMEIPSDYKQLPVQMKGLEFVVPTHMRTGGVLIYYPLSVAKAEGI